MQPQTDSAFLPSTPGIQLAALAGRFAAFRAAIGNAVHRSRDATGSQPLCPAAQVLAGLDEWAARIASAQEAADRAPETDRFLTLQWDERLAQVAVEARRALALLPGLRPTGSIADHDVAIPVSRIPKSSPKPVARTARNRASHSRGRRR